MKIKRKELFAEIAKLNNIIEGRDLIIDGMEIQRSEDLAIHEGFRKGYEQMTEIIKVAGYDDLLIAKEKIKNQRNELAILNEMARNNKPLKNEYIDLSKKHYFLKQILNGHKCSLEASQEHNKELQSKIEEIENITRG